MANPVGDFVLDPAVTSELDYEVELAFVIGRTGKNIKREDALSYVFGYTVANDISARDLQGRHQQFFKGKSLDGACPLGPWIVTADEIPNPAALTVRLRVNGEQRQESSVSDLIFDVPTLIEYLSLGATLEAGTIVCTGTPSGVGLGYTPPNYLKVGDVVEAEIDSHRRPPHPHRGCCSRCRRSAPTQTRLSAASSIGLGAGPQCAEPGSCLGFFTTPCHPPARSSTSTSTPSSAPSKNSVTPRWWASPLPSAGAPKAAGWWPPAPTLPAASASTPPCP